MKTAWIFPGGSARAVYTAGVIYALCEMNVKKPDIIIGCSGSAPTCLCYVAGQKEVIKKVWLESLSTKEFVNFWRFWKVVNIDYLVDIAIRKNTELDMSRVAESPINVYLPLTDPQIGEVVYFSNRMDADMWDVIKAAVSVPIWTDLFSLKGNIVNGKSYCDSPPAARYQVHVKKALEEGAERIIVFDNWHPSDNPTGYFFTKAYAFLRGGEFKENQLQYFQEIENFAQPQNIEFIKIQPSKGLRMSRFENDNDNARRIFKRGYDDVMGNEQLGQSR